MNKNDAQRDNVISDQYKIGAYFYDFIVFIFQLLVGGSFKWRKALIDLVDPKPTDKILELCCGTASVSLGIAKKIKTKVWACDLSKDQIKVAKFKSHFLKRDVELSILDASATNYTNSAFNKIIISGALHEIKKDRREAIYQEIKRLLTLNGKLFISEPDLPNNWWGRESFEFMFGKWNKEHETAYEIIGDGLKKELFTSGFIQNKTKESNFGIFKSREFLVRA